LKLFGLILFLFLSFCLPAQETKSTADSLGIMPEFTFYNLYGQVFTPDSLKKGKHKTVIIYFKTSCEFCLSEFKIIKHNRSEFPETQFVLVSREPVEDLVRYDSLRQFSHYPHIRVLQDKNNNYYSYYTAHYTPSIHIYDEKRRLIRFSDGMISKEELIRLLKN
jgi:hypothetical protein